MLSLLFFQHSRINTPAAASRLIPLFRHTLFVYFCTSKYNLPISGQAIDCLHNKMELVDLQSHQNLQTFAYASGTGRVRGELGLPQTV